MNRPAWVVTLFYTRGGMKEVRDVKYVRAATQEGAVRTAKAHSTLPLNCSAYARIATPQDLGCEPTQMSSASTRNAATDKPSDIGSIAE